MNTNDPLLDDVEAFLQQQARSRASFEAMKALVPGLQATLELAAHRTVVAIQCSFLAPETVQSLRDALAFAEECERAEHDHPDTPA